MAALAYFESSGVLGRILLENAGIPESLVFHSWAPMHLLYPLYRISASALPGAQRVNIANQPHDPLPVRHCMNAFLTLENPRADLARRQVNRMRQQVLRQP